MLVQALVEAPLAAVSLQAFGKGLTGAVMRDVRVHPNTMLEEDPLGADGSV